MRPAEAALRLMAQLDAARRAAGQRSPLLGRDAVSASVALGVRAAPFLDVAPGFLRHALVSRSEAELLRLAAADPGALAAASPAQLAAHLSGRRRYEALKAGGHLRAASLADLIAWLGGRPAELWYAVRDAGAEGALPPRLLLALPPRCVLELMTTAGAADRVPPARLAHEPFLRALLARQPRAGLVRLLEARTDVAALVADHWLRRRLLDARLLLHALRSKRLGGGAPPSAAWLAGTLSGVWLERALRHARGGFSGCCPAWLWAVLRRWPDSLLVALRDGGHLRRLSATWLSGCLPPSRLLAALTFGGHLDGGRLCSPVWLRAHLPRGDLAVALIRSGLAPLCSDDWLAASLDRHDVASVLQRDVGRLHLRSVEWLAAWLPPAPLAFVMERTGRLRDVAPEWIAAHLPPMPALQALLCVPAHRGALTPAFLRAHFSGGVLLHAYDELGLLSGREPLEELSRLFPGAVLRALRRCGREDEFGAAALARHVSADDLVEHLWRTGGGERETADGLADLLAGDAALCSALCACGLAGSVSLGWLCARARGHPLLRALSSGGHLQSLDADTLAELFDQPTLLDALDVAGLLGGLGAERLAALFANDATRTLLALRASGALAACEPRWLMRLLPPRLALAALAGTDAYKDIDPDVLRDAERAANAPERRAAGRDKAPAPEAAACAS